MKLLNVTFAELPGYEFVESNCTYLSKIYNPDDIYRLPDAMAGTPPSWTMLSHQHQPWESQEGICQGGDIPWKDRYITVSSFDKYFIL